MHVRRTIRRVALAAVSVGLLALSGAQALAHGRPGSPAPYTIGFVNSLTGPDAIYGQSMVKGTELAVAEINARGGIHGHRLVVLYRDDQSSPTTAIADFNDLVGQRHVPVVMGAGASTISLALAPLAVQHHVVLISSISTNPRLAQVGGPWFFGVMTDDNAQGAYWVKVAQFFHVKKVALFYVNNDYGLGVRNVFVRDFRAAGGQIVLQESFNDTDTDFRAILTRLAALHPKLTFVAAYPTSGVLLFRQAKELGVKTQWVTDVDMVSNQIAAQAKGAMVGYLGLSAGNHTLPQYKAFAAAFTKMFHEPPTIWSDFAYDTTMLVADAIAKGGYSADGIRRALGAIHGYPGASGVKTFHGAGFTDGTFQLYVVNKADQWVPYPKTP